METVRGWEGGLVDAVRGGSGGELSRREVQRARKRGAEREGRRDTVTINFLLMGVQRRNEVVGEGWRVSRVIALAVTNSGHIVSATLMT